MALDPVRLEAAIHAALVAALGTRGWAIAGAAPTAGDQAGNANVAPLKVIDDLAFAVSSAVAVSVVTEIITFAQATGTTHGSPHVLPIV